MKHFGNFDLITEALSFDKVQVVILSNLEAESTTVDAVVKACKGLGVPCYPLNVKTAFIKEFVNKRNDIKIGDADCIDAFILALNGVKNESSEE